MPEYTHTLIPVDCNFIPEPAQVGAFVEELVQLRASPLKASLAVLKPSDKVRKIVNPFTLQTESLPISVRTKVANVGAIQKALKSLAHYDLVMTGKGPSKCAPFVFEHKGSYDFAIKCCLRAELVSTSDWHDDAPEVPKQKVAFFGRKCAANKRMGIFHHPMTGKIIEAPNAGCARFWVEFEFGKSLFPDIKDSLNLINPLIIEAAQKHFGVGFIQGCRWCA